MKRIWIAILMGALSVGAGLPRIGCVARTARRGGRTVKWASRSAKWAGRAMDLSDVAGDAYRVGRRSRRAFGAFDVGAGVPRLTGRRARVDKLGKFFGGLDNLPPDLGGKRYGKARLGKLENYLVAPKRETGMAIADDLRSFGELEIVEDIHGAFQVGPGFPPILYVKQPATRHWVWHELLHYRDYKDKGLLKYLSQTSSQSEDVVFKGLSATKRRWGMLNRAERLDAIGYQVVRMKNSADTALPVMNKEEKAWYEVCKRLRDNVRK